MCNGHGWVWGWLDGPPMTIADLPGLDNDDMLPLVQSYACETGMYEHDSFIEAWVLARGGAIASWGSSTASYFDEDDVMQRAVYDAWFGAEHRRVRSLLDQGQWAVWNHYGGQGPARGYFEQYNLMGDPSLDVWTAPPAAIEVSAPDGVAAGATEVAIEVADEGTGEAVAGALDADLAEGDRLELVVTGHDIAIHEGWLVVDAADEGCQCSATGGPRPALLLLAASGLTAAVVRRRSHRLE
jgi:MYXO-CTERM domain-containing protein